MWSALFNKSDWRLLRAAIVGLLLAMLVLAWSITLYRLEAEKKLSVEIARTQQHNLAIIVAENLEQLLDGARIIALASADWWEGPSRQVAERLTAMRASNPAFLNISLYDLAGNKVYGSSPVADDAAIAQAMKSAAKSISGIDARGKLLSPGVAQPKHVWQRHLVFPVGKLGAKPLGMLLVTLDLGYLLNTYQQIEFGPTGVIHILTHDGRQVMEWRPEGLVLGMPRGFSQFSRLKDRSGSLTGNLLRDGDKYLSSFRRAERSGFLLVVSRGMDDILARYLENRSQTFSVLSILTVLFVTCAFLVSRSIARQGKLLAALTASNEKNHLLISRLEDERSRAFSLAAHDHLTGLPNRRTFNDLVTSHLSNARRHGGHYAVMYLDLDRFKLINDTLGHLVGDIVLQSVASRLRASLRESDIVARLGGDEFAIFLTGFDTVDQLIGTARKLIAQVGHPVYTEEGVEVQTGPSIGIALFPKDGRDLDSLCRSADAAMYESKRRGRGTYTFYDAGLNPCSEKKFNFEKRFSKALSQNELVLHFQPQVRLSDFRIVGFEALVRWNHPEMGMIYPDDFIPVAEETGLILALDEWVARAACEQLVKWRDEGLEPVPLSINMSASHLQRDEFPETLAGLLSRHGLPPGSVGIEVTETVLLGSLEAAGKVLRRLEAMGTRISLDDFGSGFSSLSYVRMFPVHVIKIDKQFMQDIRNSTHDAVLVSSIISLAHNLQIQVVAEGLETLEQLIHLKTAGCDQAQGYYFSRPVPSAEAAQLLLGGTLMPSWENTDEK